MREIKFRAWIPMSRQMIDVDVLAINPVGWGSDGTGVSLAYQPHVKVMQYTGLKDENSKEIYEGDILGCTGEMPLLVEYSKNHAAFVFVDKFDPPSDTIYTVNCISWGGFEVIGNIYENPELLDWKYWEALK